MFFTIPSSAKQIIANTPIGARSIRFLFFQNKNDNLFRYKSQPDRISISIDGRQICRNLLVLPFCTGAPDGAQVRQWQDVAIPVNMNVDFSEIKIDGGQDNDFNIVFVCSDQKVDEAAGFEFWETKSVKLKADKPREEILRELTAAYTEAQNAAINSQDELFADLRQNISAAEERLSTQQATLAAWKDYSQRYITWYETLYLPWALQEGIETTAGYLQQEYAACQNCIDTADLTVPRESKENINSVLTHDYNYELAADPGEAPTAVIEPTNEPTPPSEDASEAEMEYYYEQLDQYNAHCLLYQQYLADKQAYDAAKQVYDNQAEERAAREARAAAKATYLGHAQEHVLIHKEFVRQVIELKEWLREYPLNEIDKISLILNLHNLEKVGTEPLNASSQLRWKFRYYGFINGNLIDVESAPITFTIGHLHQAPFDYLSEKVYRFVDDFILNDGTLYTLHSKFTADELPDPRSLAPLQPESEEIGAQDITTQKNNIAALQQLNKTTEQIRTELTGLSYEFPNPFYEDYQGGSIATFTKTADELSALAESIFINIASKQENFFGQENVYTFDYPPRKFFALNVIKPLVGDQILTLTAPLNITISGADNEVLPSHTDLAIFTSTDVMPHTVCEFPIDPSAGVHRSLIINIDTNVNPTDMTINTGSEQWILYLLFGYRKIV